ncbi:DDE-type integrase/transposase/recombinase [Chryseobacterium sp. EO14]|uniref:DDE-type integrase/transposase/recombinase n=1 Tax=Chryseobacterium sp. EO14 TaxID=2950551 RepID=UPI00210CD7EC
MALPENLLYDTLFVTLLHNLLSSLATCPNEIWHADVTEFVTSDNVKFYVHSVLDNFSRKIIAYTISRNKTAKTRLISLKEAIMVQFGNVLSTTDLDLIVDGGSENNNFRIHNFIRHCKVTIHKKIALKDVHFSNSMIEGHFKTLEKFLRSKGEIHSNEFHKVIDYFVNDYNSIRPHYQHQIYTHDEMHNQPELIDIKPQLERINKERLQANRVSCRKIA